MKNVLKGIVICLCAIFLMSHNVAAISAGGFIPDTAIGTFAVSRTTGVFDGTAVCNNTGSPSYTKQIYTNWRKNGFAATGRDYLIAIPFFNPSNNNALDAKIPLSWYTNNTAIWVKETEVIQNSSSESTLYLIVNISDSVTDDSGYFALYTNDNLIMQDGECMGNLGWTTRIEWQGIKDYSVQLQNLNNAIQSLNSNMPSQQSINNINSSIQNLNSAVNNHYQAEQDALDNISDQDASDLSGDTDNQQSTNLIGLFSSFVNALGNITASNNCNITLAFPSFAGGSQTVNVCQNKDKGGNLVAIFSSLTLIAFYIPLALKLLSMILNEIRSFTNG